MKILITGANGFVGSSMIQHFSAKPNIQIIANSRKEINKFNNFTNIEYLISPLEKLTMDINCDICIHCAGLASDKATQKELWLNNVFASKILLSKIPNCKKMIFISSSSIYDFTDDNIKSEGDVGTLNQLSEYGKSKLLAEQEIINSQIESIYIFRPRAIYGSNDSTLLPRILKLIKFNCIFVPGSLDVLSSLTSIFNLMEATEQAILNTKKGCFIYNISDNETYRLENVFEQIVYASLKKKIKFVHLPIQIISTIVKISNLFQIKLNITNQSLNYLTKNSILNNKKSLEELNLTMADNLHQYCSTL
ncbi:MAG: NAD(P)-dependent oxidoreductase [Saprospiraceae bacterium]